MTLFLGLLFVAGQTFAWLQLRSQGFGLATNVSYSFFYVLTVAHALHVFGGLGGLVRVIGKLKQVRSATKHSGRHLALLAFHGRAVAVSAFAALDEALTQSKVGGNVSQADLSIHGQVSRTSATEIMTAPAFSVPAKKMAMWLFIIADSATFAGCLVAYGFIRNATPDWPRPFHSITNVAVMTFILLTSSLTMLIGVRSAQTGDKAKALSAGP